jgi:hypothetical protein
MKGESRSLLISRLSKEIGLMQFGFLLSEDFFLMDLAIVPVSLKNGRIIFFARGQLQCQWVLASGNVLLIL